MRHTLPTIAAALLCACAPPNVELNAERLLQGAFHYRTLVDGKEAGGSLIRIEKLPGLADRYMFTNQIEGAFSQSWESVTTGVFTPLSAKLTFDPGGKARVGFDLRYSNGGRHVAGFNGPARNPVNEDLAEDTVDQRIDWAAVMAIPNLGVGMQHRFYVYDPGTGNSPVLARVTGFETTTVPLGTYETARIVYRIEKKRGAEQYEVLVTRKGPRFMVKETFPNGSATELMAYVASR